jgi:hypothetical protein
MKARGFWSLGEVSDEQLERRLLDLLAAGGRTDARIVAHLAEVDARRLHLLGGRSLFEYCLVRLGLSESEAYYRICAARAGRVFPVVFELLERRELHLTTIALVGKHLTDENHLELLAAVRGKSKLQVLEFLARRSPKPEVPSNVRRLPVRRGMVAAGPSGTLQPLADDSYCLQLQASRALREKLELARDLMSHANPSGDLAVVVERALDALIEKLRARRFGQSKQTRGARGQLPDGSGSGSGSGKPDEGRGEAQVGARGPSVERNEVARRRKHITRAVRREVLERDGLCCSYVSPEGHRCEARAFLELDHERAWAKGGEDSVENLRVLCRAHNRLKAEWEFGERVPAGAG